MPETYVNVPMTEQQAKRVAQVDKTWNGPKLLALCAVVLGLAFALLNAAAWRAIGPSYDEPPPLIEFTDSDTPLVP